MSYTKTAIKAARLLHKSRLELKPGQYLSVRMTENAPSMFILDVPIEDTGMVVIKNEGRNNISTFKMIIRFFVKFLSLYENMFQTKESLELDELIELLADKTVSKLLE
jgi:hypothetical protein